MLLSCWKQVKTSNYVKVMKVFASIPVKSTKAEQQYQHGIINVEAIRDERQNTHGAHDLTEEEETNDISISYQ